MSKDEMHRPRPRYIDRDEAKENEKFRIRSEQRLAFLNDSDAIRTPIEVAALWMALFVHQGGVINHVYKMDYVREYESEANRSSKAQNSWMLTRSTDGVVPAGYGSTGMTLTIPPSVADQNTERSTNDLRSGSEYGHTKLRQFIVDGNRSLNLRAVTNEDYVYSYQDVEALRKRKTLQQLLDDVRALSQDFSRGAKVNVPHSEIESSQTVDEIVKDAEIIEDAEEIIDDYEEAYEEVMELIPFEPLQPIEDDEDVYVTRETESFDFEASPKTRDESGFVKIFRKLFSK